MPRPKKVNRPVEKSISLPETLCAQVDLMLWSELEERVPHGAWARYVRGLLEQDQLRRAQGQHAVRNLLQQET